MTRDQTAATARALLAQMATDPEKMARDGMSGARLWLYRRYARADLWIVAGDTLKIELSVRGADGPAALAALRRFVAQLWPEVAE